MYELPEKKETGATYEITEAMVKGEVIPTLFAAHKTEAKKESA